MNGNGIKILCVDKNDADIARLQTALAHAQTSEFTLVHVNDLDQASAYVTTENISIILIDLLLLDRRGLDALGFIRTRSPNIPIILLTETDSEALAMQAVQTGVQDYLIKQHIDSDHLIWKLRYAVEHQMRVVAQQHIQELQISEARFYRVITRNADGIIVVDDQGIVCMVNPAAEELMGRNSGELLGQNFGFPLLVGETTELDIIRPGKEAAVAEMRIVEIDWDDSIAFLTSLRDITEHRKLEETLRATEQFSRSILNSMTAHIAVLNEHGIIIAINDAWKEFLKENGDPALEYGGIGDSYIIMCERRIGPCRTESTAALAGLRDVLRGERDFFVLEYPYHLLQEERWFMMRVTPLVNETRRGVVVSHTDITAQRQANEAAAEAEAQAARAAQLERELNALLQITGTHSSAVTSALFGKDSLHTSAPDLYANILQRYGELLDLALEERAYKIEYNLSDHLRMMANQLGFLKAGPRDVVQIHSTVLQKKSSESNPRKNQAYLEEGRMMVLELMGYLVSYYRNYAVR